MIKLRVLSRPNVKHKNLHEGEAGGQDKRRKGGGQIEVAVM